MYTNLSFKQRSCGQRVLSRILVLVLVAALSLSVVQPASAATTQTKTTSIAVLQTKGIFKIFNYYGKDNFKVTYYPDTNTIKKVKTSASIRLPKGFEIIERESITRKKLSASQWRFTSTWYLNFNSLPAPMQAIAEKKVPVLAAICSIGRFVAFRATYLVKGDGSVTRTKIQYKLMVPSNLAGAAKILYNAFIKK